MRTRKIIGWITFAAIMLGCVVVLALAGASMIGCATATVDAPVCDTQSANLGTAPALPSVGVSQTVTLPPAPVSFDLSDPLKKVTDVADSVQVSVNSLTIDNSSHDLDWVRGVQVSITGSATDGSTDAADFASGSWSGPPGTSLSLSVAMSGDKVLHYLQSGQVTLNITASGDASTSAVPAGTQLVNGVNLCVDAQGTVSKSL